MFFIVVMAKSLVIIFAQYKVMISLIHHKYECGYFEI